MYIFIHHTSPKVDEYHEPSIVPLWATSSVSGIQFIVLGMAQLHTRPCLQRMCYSSLYL